MQAQGIEFAVATLMQTWFAVSQVPRGKAKGGGFAGYAGTGFALSEAQVWDLSIDNGFAMTFSTFARCCPGHHYEVIGLHGSSLLYSLVLIFHFSSMFHSPDCFIFNCYLPSYGVYF